LAKVLEMVNGIRRLRTEAGTVSIYDETSTIGVGGLTTGSPLTLPSSQTYTSDELEVYLNGQRMDAVLDYNVEGSPPRTQISWTFDLVENDLVRFRIDRSA
jgi:hypothetical protein